MEGTYLLIPLLLLSLGLFAQVGVNGDGSSRDGSSRDGSAMLDVKSTDKEMLPRCPCSPKLASVKGR